MTAPIRRACACLGAMTSGCGSPNAMTAGGYNATLPVGTYTAVASGGGMRYPVSIPNVIVGGENVWLNFIYDPTAVPPDARESNDSWASATPLSGRDQTLTDGTIHRGDGDYFRVRARTGRAVRVGLGFANSNGNLALRILDAIGNVVARSATTSDLETVTVDVLHGRTYYVVVEHPGGGTGGPYTLQLITPPARAPMARPDTTTTAITAGTVSIDVLANDADPDGDMAAARVNLSAVGRGTAQLTGDARKILYTAPANFSGVDHLSYTLIDEQGLSSTVATVSIMVLDFSRPRPFQNSGQPMDVNGDGTTSAIDALLVINELNTRNARTLPTTISGTENMFGLVDVNGNGSVEPMDALLVINTLNTAGGAAEGEAAPLDTLEELAWTGKRRR